MTRETITKRAIRTNKMLIFVVILCGLLQGNAFTLRFQPSRQDTKLFHENDRRYFLTTFTSFAIVTTKTFSSPAIAVERAIGTAEKKCREEGNCLENFDIDGAVGWNWGGKDRCDATDPRCGVNGQLQSAPPKGQPVPLNIDDSGNTLNLSQVFELEVIIGKSEKQRMKIGLYGDACPSSVAQFLDFLTTGIITTSKLMLQDGLGVMTQPVKLINGGALNIVYPQSRLDFGISSQGLAYAKTRRMNKIPDSFVPQPRPMNDDIANEKSARTHSCAGLLSIPKRGLGYGGTFDSDDEAFASSFQITATENPSMDREGRKVIGQIMDDSSMEVLARLSSLATKKGLKGILPGQDAGPPLLKVIVSDVGILSKASNSD